MALEKVYINVLHDIACKNCFKCLEFTQKYCFTSKEI